MRTTNYNNSTNNNSKSNAYKLREGLPMLTAEDFAKLASRQGKGKLVTIKLEWPDENGSVIDTTEIFFVPSAKKETTIEAQNEVRLEPEERYRQYKDLGWTDGNAPFAYVSHSVDPTDEFGLAKAIGKDKEFFIKLSLHQFRSMYFRQYGVWPEVNFAKIQDKASTITPTKAIAATTITLKPKAKASSRR